MQLLNPYPDIRPNHPLVAREARRLHWLKRAGTPGRYSRWVILFVLGIVLLLYVGWLLFHWWQLSFIGYDPYYDTYWFQSATLDFLMLVGAMSLLAILPLDFVSITTALNSISGEMVSGTWDLLRLTSVREAELVLAKHSATQLRAWRTTMWVIGLRIATSLIALIGLISGYLLESQYSSATSPELSFLFLLTNFIPIAGLFGVFIFEPLWRMRAVTALGMVISSRSRDGASSALLGIGTLLGLWLLQMIIVIAMLAGMTVLLFTLLPFGAGAFCIPWVLLLIAFPTVRGFYSILKTWGLRRVARRLVLYSS
jgi:hypothetical protein